MIHRKYKHAFPHVYRFQNLTIKMIHPLTPAEIEEFKIAAYASAAEDTRKSCYVSRDRSHFIKLNKIKRLSKQLRVSLGIAKPFDYFLKELENNVALNALSIQAPRLTGYLLYSKMGLTQRGGLVFDNLEGKEGAGAYINAYPSSIAPTIALALRLLADLQAKNIFHMDPRLENMMIDPVTPERLSAIDFEHCYIGEPADKAAMTGMVYGMFYKSGVTAHISEREYDQLVMAVADQYMPHLNFQEIYSRAKSRFMEREECRNMFMLGHI